ncbi:hypothetical protein MSS4_02607 [Mycobacterium marinum]|uniref:Uncharacterized protein n=1 Tax=Mycobacterium marinum TaxID=1781 RepID=A0A3E2MSG2_MYCMR|nr:hypothetical protein DAVIS_03867 [Mycobacterium marinum]RFZ39535.1 hypothetical protein NCTC2275_00125 [Mycobacterium marinum]RFZ49242.1 hypothetical protein MSS4_02607 [Mycobacterium marinum]
MIGHSGGGKSVVREQPHDCIAATKGGHIRAGVDDDARGFAAESFLTDGTQRHHDITEVEPGSTNGHADLSRA